jgi:LPS export ABC transporter protein LptC
MFFKISDKLKHINHSITLLLIMSVMLLSLYACSQENEHIAPAIHDRDSVAMMISYGVNTLISDSGVIKYRIVSERWEVNTNTRPTKWSFLKGIFLEQFDEKFHIQACITADTAWYYDQKKLWELRGRVYLRNNDGLVFRSQELFWNQNTHQLYSHMFSRVVTPDRQLQGANFISDEHMTNYTVNNTKGAFPAADMSGENMEPASTTQTSSSDTTKAIPMKRQIVHPFAAKSKQTTP